MADALGVVNVGKSECGFLKLTPLSRTAAIAGAVVSSTMRARSPSGTKRITLWGWVLEAAGWARLITARATRPRPLMALRKCLIGNAGFLLPRRAFRNLRERTLEIKIPPAKRSGVKASLR